MEKIQHRDGTMYHVERRANGRLYDLYFVYATITGKATPFYSRVYANTVQGAIDKAREHYAKHLGLI